MDRNAPFESPRQIAVSAYWFVGFALFVALALMLGARTVMWHFEVRGHVPAALAPGYLASGEEGDAQGLVRYSIGGEAVRAISAEGPRFLERRAGEGWRPTPLSLESVQPNEECPGFWCSESPVTATAADWLARPGSFVRRSVRHGDRFILIVNPRERAVIYGYLVD